jgi:hemerythrin superfamily protein
MSEGEALMNVDSKVSDLEAFTGTTHSSTYYEDHWGVNTAIRVMSDGKRFCKDEEGFWSTVGEDY